MRSQTRYLLADLSHIAMKEFARSGYLNDANKIEHLHSGVHK
jgi:hypothetical protein